jgi:hypothetical protein
MPRSRSSVAKIALALTVTVGGTAAAGTLDYTPYSRTGQFVVSWQSLGQSTIYVYQEVNGGGWELIHSESAPPDDDNDGDPLPTPPPVSTAAALPDGGIWVGPLPDGTHRFIVSRCDQWGNCYTEVGEYMSVRRPPALDIVTEHPQVAQARQRSEAYQARTRPFVADQESHWLGQGWDTLTGKIKRLCLDLDAAPTMVITPMRQEHMAVDIAQDDQELAHLMRIDFSADLAVRYAKFAADTDVRTSVYHDTRMRRHASVIVAQWSYTDEHWQIAARSAPLHPEYQALLDPDRPDRNPVNFNQDCGDEIVHSVHVGARAFLVVTFNHTVMSEETVRQTSANVRAKFEEVLNAGASGTWSTADRSYFSSIGLQIRTYGEGGPAGILSGGLMAPDLALSRFHQFIAASNADTFVAVDKFHDLYELPSPWLSRPYYSVFADPRPAFQKLGRWLNADRQAGSRCHDLETSDAELSATTYTPRCFNAKRDLMFEIDDCANATRWGGCIEPQGSSVLATIDTRIPAMDPHVAQSSIDLYVGSRLSKRCGSATVTARVPDRACIADRTRTEGPTDECLSGNHGAPGYGRFVESCFSPASGGSARHFLRRDYSVGGAYSLVSSVTVCAERLYGHNAWYQGTQDLYAKCPVTRPIELE